MLRPNQHRARLYSPAQRGSVYLSSGLLLLLLAATPLLAQTTGLQIVWFTMNGGGGASYAIRGTVGQPNVNAATGGGDTLTSGFWASGGNVSQGTEQAMYLPFVRTMP